MINEDVNDNFILPPVQLTDEQEKLLYELNVKLETTEPSLVHSAIKDLETLLMCDLEPQTILQYPDILRVNFVILIFFRI